MRGLGTSEASSSTRPAKHLARWWEPEAGGKVHCYLCPRHCHIGQGQAGFCFIRANEGGKLYSLGYAHPAALQIDPIEKKPLNHFLPGTNVFSVGTAGCNMGCFFCQNWSISKSKSDHRHSTYMPPEEVVEMAIENNCPSIAFTYNEPTIWGEYVIDICKVAHEHGLKTVMVSNGYVTYEAFHDIYDHIDAANIDLKAFTEKFYGCTTLTHLQPVLDTLKWLKTETSVWFEITNLLIPTLNDSPSETRALCEWILENLGPDVPLHFTAFHPDFKLRDKPRTPEETLHVARAIALEVGLHYVYEGNIRSGNAHTQCPSCNSMLIRRSWHNVLENRLAVCDLSARSVEPGMAGTPAAAILPAIESAPTAITEQILQQRGQLRNLDGHFGSRMSDAGGGRIEALSQIANVGRDESAMQQRRLPNEQRSPSAPAPGRASSAPVSGPSVAQYQTPGSASDSSTAQHRSSGSRRPIVTSSLDQSANRDRLLRHNSKSASALAPGGFSPAPVSGPVVAQGPTTDSAFDSSTAQYRASGKERPAANSASLEYPVEGRDLMSQYQPPEPGAPCDRSEPTANSRSRESSIVDKDLLSQPQPGEPGAVFDRSTPAANSASEGSIAQHCAGGMEGPAPNSASLEYAIIEESLLSQDRPRTLDAQFESAAPTANQRRRAVRRQAANSEPAATCPDCSLVIPGRWSVASTKSARPRKQ